MLKVLGLQWDSPFISPGGPMSNSLHVSHQVLCFPGPCLPHATYLTTSYHCSSSGPYTRPQVRLANRKPLATQP